MDLKIFPSKLEGSIKIPPSKSIAHRAIICASLADGRSELDNIAYSDDINASINAMKSLGASFERDGKKLIVYGKSSSKVNSENIKIDCCESGSTIRFLLPILTLFKGKYSIHTKGRLLDRPMTPYYEIFDKEDVEYKREGSVLEIFVKKSFESSIFNMRGDISSQFISGMMFMLPLLNHDSEIVISGKMESKSYVDLTIDCLNKFGITIENNNYKSFYISGNQSYKSRDLYIEGDYSQLAFFAVADALGNKVEILDIEKNSLQGDKKILEILESFGAKLEFGKDGKSLKIIESKKKAYNFNGSQIPDIVPIISLLASLSEGKTEISDISRLKIKESDRLKAVYTELSKLGASIEMGEDFLIIQGVKSFKGKVKVDSYKDHRIAMTLAIAATVCEEEIVLQNAEVVSKSYPNFWEDYRKLGGKYECYMGEKF
ncbi:3-phosphoshikimate 1-carboxyvinyltransferase [Peptostreptococcus russellii]|uniref:3-phosphoshikimate 1-carboxyvinyltransferase n=1 Tax=Peptostreptococcus russellii TaxID=215200 RepID=UPI0016263083|nr:3-phosphoshikimate 1-carboxyvinyltransferase [Peptostreptococcus russellii]MBC2578404.1 3-phosphoshikimate 1-carboxyvinyltransferase [Peptostreptococcus russellii]